MKVWIENADIDWRTVSGKSRFTALLASGLRSIGVEVTSRRSERSHIALHVIRVDKSVNAEKHVARIDGVYHNFAQDYERRNDTIKLSVRIADGVVYQSEHSRRLADAFLGPVSSKTVTILNASSAVFWGLVGEATDVPQSKVAITFAKWRPHKRLEDTMASFVEANVRDSVLLVAGDVSKSGVSSGQLTKYFNHPRIRYLGELPLVDLAPYIKRANIALHLCWFDACPNGVCESLCAGTPVLTNNVGGTHELLEAVNLNSYVLQTDLPYDYQPCDLYNPPQVDRRYVARWIHKAFDYPLAYNINHVDIPRAAKQYKDFFYELL